MSASKTVNSESRLFASLIFVTGTVFNLNDPWKESIKNKNKIWKQFFGRKDKLKLIAQLYTNLPYGHAV